MRTLLWYRGKDLRVSDHLPLLEAVRGGEVIPVFVLDPYFFEPTRAREAPHRMQYLLGALRGLGAALSSRGSGLLVVEGRSVDVVPRLAEQWRVDRVAAHRWVEPFARERDRRVASRLSVPFDLYEGETLLPPGSVRTRGGEPFRVFTPFTHAFAREAQVGRPLPAPRSLPPLPEALDAPTVEVPALGSLGIARNSSLITPGEVAAKARLARFLAGAGAAYDRGRDRMDLDGTSRISADLKFGTLSVRSVWHASHDTLGGSRSGAAFRNELLWREFTHHTLWDRPDVLKGPFQPLWRGFPWRSDPEGWEAWTQGRTGYPLVDAAARQLLEEGFVHNRARMISASFLTRHLIIDYRKGEAHYLRYLTDGDWAQNNAGWQWAAGSGTDAQPYFRIFNPVAQGRYDPSGDYVRRWVPELGAMPDRYLHRPWEAPAHVLEAAGVRLGQNYPRPIVDHGAARDRYLELAQRHLEAARRGTVGGPEPAPGSSQ